MYGIGFGLGAGLQALDVVGTKAVVIAGESYPTTARAFTFISTKAAPAILGGLYATDVGIRATEGGKNFGAGTIASNLGGITTTEVAPMTAGGVGGYKTVDVITSRYPSIYTVGGSTDIVKCKTRRSCSGKGNDRYL